MIAAPTDISSTDTRTTAVRTPRVLIAAGGTGGHVYPGIAIADALRELHTGSELLFVGTRNRMEWQTVPKAGYEIQSIWISGFHRRLTPLNLLFPLKLFTSLIQSYRILKRYRPDVVVSCGGFVAGPVGWVAAKMGIPLVLQEQNSYPGVTNRFLAGYADIIFTAFEEASRHLKAGPVVVSGNPLRSGFDKVPRGEALARFGFHSKDPVLLVLGGSGGAKTINDALERNIHLLHDKMKLQIIWQCGRRYFQELAARVDTGELKNLRLLEYIDPVADAYAAADLVISRAGALSCSELMLTGKPAILVPSPTVAGDHQTRNAAAMTDEGAAVLLEDGQVVQQLPHAVNSLIFDRQQLQTMSRKAKALARPDAAALIAREIATLSRRDHE